GGAEIPDRVEQCRLEAGEREVEPGDPRHGEVERLWISVPRQPVDRGATRVAEPEETCSLVERLSRSVVERRPEPFGAAALAHGEKERVTAAREQACGRRLDGALLEVELGDVALEVVDRNERHPPCPR